MNLGTLGIQVARSENLPVLPTVVVQILNLYNNPGLSIRSLEAVIEKDPAMSARVLKIASSSFYGVKAVNSINKALSVIGMNSLRSIAVSLALQQILNRKESKPAYDQLALWRHCLAVGVGSRALMKQLDAQHAEDMYIAGLVHDIGILVIDRFSQPELIRALAHAQQDSIPLQDALFHELGYDQSHVGLLLADKWGLSGIVTHVIKNVDSPRREKLYPKAVMVAAAANFMAYYAGFPTIPGLPGNPMGLQYLSEMELSQKAIDDIISLIMAEVDSADEMLGSTRAA